MLQLLRDLQQAQGASLDGEGRPLTFGRDEEGFEAVGRAVVVCDRSHWGLLQIAGADRLRFIHNQTTHSFAQRQPGQGVDTVFVTSTARTLDLATVYVTAEALIMLVSPGQDQRLFDWMDRFIFPADQVDLTNLTGQMAVFSLIGPQSPSLLQGLGVNLPPDLPTGHHEPVDVGTGTVRLAAGSGLGLPGYTLLIPAAEAASLWQQLTAAGALPAGITLWEQLRVCQGRPAAGAELTEEFNPLEAGLWQAVSFDKGCYIGQETIARLNTYQGVKQQLWGLQISQRVQPGEPIWVGAEKVGQLTSVVETPAGVRGLGYIRTKAGGAGLTVTVGGIQGQVVEVPYLSRGYLAPT